MKHTHETTRGRHIHTLHKIVQVSSQQVAVARGGCTECTTLSPPRDSPTRTDMDPGTTRVALPALRDRPPLNIECATPRRTRPQRHVRHARSLHHIGYPSPSLPLPPIFLSLSLSLPPLAGLVLSLSLSLSRPLSVSAAALRRQTQTHSTKRERSVFLSRSPTDVCTSSAPSTTRSPARSLAEKDRSSMSRSMIV